MKRILIAAAVPLLIAGCGTEPQDEVAAPAPASGASINHEAENPFEEQRNAWLTECHDLIDAERATAHDIDWGQMVNLGNDGYRLIGTAAELGGAEFQVVCDVNSNWSVSIDHVLSSIPRDSGAMMSTRYAADFNHDWAGKADDIKVDKCLDILSAEYGEESVSVVIDFSSINRTDQGAGHVIDGTSTGTEAGEVMEFACSVPNYGEPELIWFFAQK